MDWQEHRDQDLMLICNMASGTSASPLFLLKNNAHLTLWHLHCVNHLLNSTYHNVISKSKVMHTYKQPAAVRTLEILWSTIMSKQSSASVKAQCALSSWQSCPWCWCYHCSHKHCSNNVQVVPGAGRRILTLLVAQSTRHVYLHLATYTLTSQTHFHIVFCTLD